MCCSVPRAQFDPTGAGQLAHTGCPGLERGHEFFDVAVEGLRVIDAGLPEPNGLPAAPPGDLLHLRGLEIQYATDFVGVAIREDSQSRRVPTGVVVITRLTADDIEAHNALLVSAATQL